MMQNIRNTEQQIGIDAFTLENRVHIGPLATQFVGEPRYGTFLALEFLLD